MRELLINWPGKGQFSGHETFPLRLLWLKKAFDSVGSGAKTTLFQDPDSIVTFGVGRNMAISMRHWALATCVLEEVDAKLRPTALATELLSNDGWDPYLERVASIWLLHWHVASTPDDTTTIYYAFHG